MRRYAWLALGVAGTVFLAGCGLKGPLYLPHEKPKASAQKASPKADAKHDKVSD